MQNLMKKIKSLKASHIQAAAFLAFIFYVGFAAFPQFLTNTGNALYWHYSPGDYIRAIDEQYSGMLETTVTLPALHDKGTYINLNGLMAELLDQPMMNERVRLTNGHLTSLVETTPAPEEIQTAADNIAALSRKQTEQGKHFLFVMVPSQVSKYEDLLPEGYTDTTNDTADRLLALLDAQGVSCLDLRESMREDGLSHADSYYVTDHHWIPQTGFWAYTKMLDKLEAMGAIAPVDSFYTEQENFEFQTYERNFLGSSGKRTGIYFAGLDDSVFIAPKFDTDISIRIDSLGMNNRGRYEDICYNTWGTVGPEDGEYFHYNSYGLYGWGDQPLTQWRNEKAPQQQKMMLIGESFGNVPYSLMSLCFTSCDELDMRHYTEDFAAYYESYDPDTVILEVNVDQAIAENTMYPYFPE